MRIPFLAILLSVPLLAPTAGAQEVEVRAGSAVVDARRVVARTDTFAIQASSGTAQMLVRITALGDTALLIVERIWAGNDATVDSLAVRRLTLEPLFFERRNSAETQTLSFSGGRVSGTVTRAGRTEKVDSQIDRTTFFLNTTNLLLASLPLREGASYRTRMWDTEMYEMRFRVVGREVVRTLEGGDCEAWRVEVGEAGDAPMIYWVEVGTQSLLAFRKEDLGFRIQRHPACPPAGSSP